MSSNIDDNLSIERCFFLSFVLLWRVRPSIRSRRRSPNTVFHFWSAVGDRGVFVLIPGAFPVPTSCQFDQHLILEIISETIVPRTTIFKSQRRPKERNVPKRLPKGPQGGVVQVTFVLPIAFLLSNLDRRCPPKSPKARRLKYF